MLYAQWDGLRLYFGTGQDERWPRAFLGYGYSEGSNIQASTPEGIAPGVSLGELQRAYPDGMLRPNEACLGTVFVAPWTEWQGDDYYVIFFAFDPDRVVSIDAGFTGWC
jgi:hypothetical protein